MSKFDRKRTEEVYTLSFVPEFNIPNKQPQALDPYLDPLISELEELFIEGSFMSFKFCLIRKVDISQSP